MRSSGEGRSLDGPKLSWKQAYEKLNTFFWKWNKMSGKVALAFYPPLYFWLGWTILENLRLILREVRARRASGCGFGDRFCQWSEKSGLFYTTSQAKTAAWRPYVSLSEVGRMDGFHEKVHKNQSVAASIKASITFETPTFDVSHIEFVASRKIKPFSCICKFPKMRRKKSSLKHRAEQKMPKIQNSPAVQYVRSFSHNNIDNNIRTTLQTANMF